MCKIKGPEDVVEAVQRYSSFSPMSPGEMLYAANECIKAYEEHYLKRLRLAQESAKKATMGTEEAADIAPDDKKISVVQQLGQLSIRGSSASITHES